MPRTNSSATSLSFPASSESTQTLAQNEVLDKSPKESFKSHTKSKLATIGLAIAAPVGAAITCLKVPAVTSFLSQSVPLFSMGSVSLTGIGAMTLAGFSAGAPLFLGGAYQGLKSVIGPLFPNTDSEFRRAKEFVKSLSIQNGNLESSFKDNQTVFRVQGRFSPFQRFSVEDLCHEMNEDHNFKSKFENLKNSIEHPELKQFLDGDHSQQLSFLAEVEANHEFKILEEKENRLNLLKSNNSMLNQQEQNEFNKLFREIDSNANYKIIKEKIAPIRAFKECHNELRNSMAAVMDKKFGQIQKRRIALVAILLPVGGALLGAAIGSLFGGFGAIPGAAVGLGVGIFLATTLGIGAHTMKGLYVEALTKHIDEFIENTITVRNFKVLDPSQTPPPQSSDHETQPTIRLEGPSAPHQSSAISQYNFTNQQG